MVAVFDFLLLQSETRRLKGLHVWMWFPICLTTLMPFDYISWDKLCIFVSSLSHKWQLSDREDKLFSPFPPSRVLKDFMTLLLVYRMANKSFDALVAANFFHSLRIVVEVGWRHSG